jgi:hypothetical protein
MRKNPCIRVLLVEDSQSDAELFGIYLEQVRSADYQIQVTDTLADAIAELKGRNSLASFRCLWLDGWWSVRD